MDKNGFNELVRRDNRRLFVMAYRMVKNQQEAEDVVQEVFIKLWKMGEELGKVNNPSFLALKMVRNSCIDILRRWKFLDPDSDKVMLSEKGEQSPHDGLVDKEEENIVKLIIDGLPSPYREVIVMKEIEGLSYNEIAVLGNNNINSLRVIVSRARQMVRDKYLDYEGRKN